MEMAIRCASREHTRLGPLNDLVQILVTNGSDSNSTLPQVVVVRTFDLLKRGYIIILGLGNKRGRAVRWTT